MIDLRRLEALVAVHRTGTVSAAAEQLHYGQPTVSHHLRRLEAETGSVLLQRVGRGVRLTPEGRRLAQRGEEILGLLERAEAELSASTSLQAGRVRIAAFPSAAATRSRASSFADPAKCFATYFLPSASPRSESTSATPDFHRSGSFSTPFRVREKKSKCADRNGVAR